MNAPRSGTRHEATRYARDPVAGVKSLLGSSEEGCLEIDVTEFIDDAAAHDDALQADIEKEYRRKHQTASALIQRMFGQPFESGDDDHDDIPAAGVFAYNLWHVEGRVLSVSACHEDRELPYMLVLGLTGE